MPEGVEITRLVKLMQKLVGDKIKFAKILAGRYKRSPPSGWGSFIRSLPARITFIRKKGKFIYFGLSNGYYIFNTLGLTGAWTLDDTPYNKVAFHLSHSITLYLFDIRNFATLKFVKEGLDDKLKSIGYDANSPTFTHRLFQNIIDDAQTHSVWNKPVAEVLLSQQWISGLGVYMVSESLYFAKLSPKRKLSSLSDTELRNLYKGIKKVSKESTRAQTFTLHIDKNISQLNEYNFRVYKHKDADRYSLGGRNIYWYKGRQH